MSIVTEALARTPADEAPDQLDVAANELADKYRLDALQAREQERKDARERERRARELAEGRERRLALMKELTATAAENFEAAREIAAKVENRRFLRPSFVTEEESRELVRWEDLHTDAACFLRDTATPLADVIEACFELLAPESMQVTPEMEAARKDDEDGHDEYIHRGVILNGIAYVLTREPDGGNDDIINRVEVGHLLQL